MRYLELTPQNHIVQLRLTTANLQQYLKSNDGDKKNPLICVLDALSNVYTWVKYASQEPTEASHSMGDIPDAWRGEYNGPLSSAPADWQKYKWYKIKGDKGSTGDPAKLLSSSTTYMVSDSGTIVPSGSWQSSVPTVPQGKYLWTRVIQTYNSGSPVTSYSVSRMGLDGIGSVSAVNGKNPDSSGNVIITTDDISAGAESLMSTLNGKQATITASGLLKGDGSGAVTPAQQDVDYASPNYVDTRHFSLTVTLSASKWANNLQTVSATGVTADATKTDVIASPAPADDSYTAYSECGVRLYAQLDGKVQFKCTDTPQRDLTVNLLVRR